MSREAWKKVSFGFRLWFYHHSFFNFSLWFVLRSRLQHRFMSKCVFAVTHARLPFRCHRNMSFLPAFVASILLCFNISSFSHMTSPLDQILVLHTHTYYCNEKLSVKFTQRAHYITSTNLHLASTSLHLYKRYVLSGFYLRALLGTKLEIGKRGKKESWQRGRDD